MPGHYGAGLFLIGLGFLDCSQTLLAVALLTLSVTVSGSSYAAFLVNHMDIAPKYAGTLFGITNGIGAASGFIAPLVAAALTDSVSSITTFSSNIEIKATYKVFYVH